MHSYTVAIVGATGMVGRKFLEVLAEQKLPVKKFYLFASARSAGQTLDFMGQPHVVEELSETCMDGKDIDVALFSAGGSISQTYAPIFAQKGIVVIDNSSAWRTNPDVPLVVPEVNPGDIAHCKNKNIIANPNCSTIQAVVALKPLDVAYGIERVVYSTYQAVSGAGMGGYEDLRLGVEGQPPKKMQHPIFANVIPHIDVFLENGYTKEEEKMIFETRRILGRPDLRVTATTVRVPVYHGHSESVNLEFRNAFDVDELKQRLTNAPGIVVVDDPATFRYPMPRDAENHDEVFVGRIRRDESIENGVNLWIVADNVRKGAATNAVQIAKELIRQWDSGELQR